jgi:hypothetical protein
MSSIARELLIEALSMGTSKLTRKVRERVASGLCLVPGCECDAVGRGLCAKHKNEYYYRLSRLRTKVSQLDFEQSAIRKGLILPVGAQRTVKRDASSPFGTKEDCA